MRRILLGIIFILVLIITPLPVFANNINIDDFNNNIIATNKTVLNILKPQFTVNKVDNTFVLSFDEFIAFDGFYIYVQENEEDFELLHITKKDDDNFVLSDVKIGVKYTFYIHSYTEESTSTQLHFKSDKISIRIPYDEEKILNTTPIFKVSFSNYSFNFTIDKLEEADRYLIYYKKSNSESFKLLTNTVKSSFKSNILFTNEQKYNFKVIALAKTFDGNEFLSKDSKIVSKEYIGASNIKTKTPTLSVKQNVLTYEFNYKINSNNVKYELYYKNSKDKNYKKIITTDKTTYIKTKGFKHNQTYMFKVRAITQNPIENKQHYSKYSKVITLKCLDKSKITSYTPILKVEQKKNNFILTYNKIPYASSYIIYYKKIGDKSLTKLATTTKTTYTTNKKFAHSKSYVFAVKALANGYDKKLYYSKLSSAASLTFYNPNVLSKFKTVKKVGDVSFNHTFNDGFYNLSSVNKMISELKTMKEITGFYLMDLKSKKSIGYNENEKFVTASVVKLGYSLYVFKLIDQLEASYDDIIKYKEEDFCGFTGIIQKSAYETEFTLKEVLYNVIYHSDNAGYYMLRRTFGTKGYIKMLKDMGASGAQIEFSRWGFLTPKDLAIIWSEIYSFKDVSKFGLDFFNLLIDAKYDFIHRELKEYEKVAHKSGYNEFGFNDSAIVLGKSDYIIVIMTTDNNPLFYKTARVLDTFSKYLI